VALEYRAGAAGGLYGICRVRQAVVTLVKESQVESGGGKSRATTRPMLIQPRECSSRSSPAPMLERGMITWFGLGSMSHQPFFPCQLHMYQQKLIRRDCHFIS